MQNSEKNLDDKEFVIKKFNAHNEDVIKTVPAERLLIFDANLGWEPLCKFLNVPVPGTPFPKTNTREEFITRAKNMPGKKFVMQQE